MEDERTTSRDVNAAALEEDEHDRPTVPAWCCALIRDLEKQLDRLYSGRACRACSGSGEELRGGKAGVYRRTCGECDGEGVKG